MNETSENEDHQRENENLDALLKDTRTKSKVALRIPFKPETFKAQSLLARFHSSRKSDSGIKSEVKTSGRRRVKTGNFEVIPSTVTSPEDTSASLPDDLHQSPQVTPGCEGGHHEAPRNDLGRVFTRCLSEEVTLASNGEGQRDVDSLFGTWPGRPRKLKSLRKRLLASAANSRITPDNAPKPVESDETQETACLLPRAMDDTPRSLVADGTVSEMPAKTSEVLGQNVSLDALLESLPLIYDPSTKQLCLGTLKKPHNDCAGKGMSGKSLIGEIDSDVHPDKQKFGSGKGVCEETESQEESSVSEVGEGPPPSKTLEIIQEVEENTETVKLIEGNSPQSGNVSGSSSLERGNYEGLRNGLQRIGTSNSLSITDASSFSSLSSLNTELSAYSASDSAVCLGSHQSDTGSLRDFALADNDGKSKKRGIADFLTR